MENKRMGRVRNMRQGRDEGGAGGEGGVNVNWEERKI